MWRKLEPMARTYGLLRQTHFISGTTMFKSLRYIEPEIISAERDDGTFVAIEPAHGDLWVMASSGALGNVTEYVPPPMPTYDERMAAWRAVAWCDMLALQDAIIDLGKFDDAEAEAANVDARWRIRWEARGGVVVRRSTPELDGFAALIGLTPEDVDDMPIWTPEKPIGE